MQQTTAPWLVYALVVFCLVSGTASWCSPLDENRQDPSGDAVINLSQPEREGEVSIEATLENRRSIRQYPGGTVTQNQLAQLLWAAQGITDPRGFRTAPSAGATFPLEVLVVVGNVSGVPAGVYRYEPDEHRIVQTLSGDLREQLAAASLGQDWVRQADASIVITAVPGRTTARYGERGVRYVHMEVGHAAQNVYLQAYALDMGTVVVGAFQDADVRTVLQLPEEEEPMAILPVGRL